MKIRAIPQVPNQLDPQLRAVLLAVKENLEMLSGQRGGNPIEELLGYTPAREEGVLPFFFGRNGSNSGTNFVQSVSQELAAGFHVTGNNIVCDVAGTYLVSGRQLISPSGAIYYAMQKNGVTVAHGYSTGGMGDLGCSAVLPLGAGDTIAFYMQGTVTTCWGGPHSDICITKC